MGFIKCSVHELIHLIKLSLRCEVHILILLVPCRSLFKMKIALNLINRWDNSLRGFLTDMSFCALRVLLSVWWLLLCWAPISQSNWLEQATSICGVVTA